MGNKFSSCGVNGMGRLHNVAFGDCSEDEDESRREQEAELGMASVHHQTGAASGESGGPSGSGQSVQHIRSYKFDSIKHKIFLTHSGAQKNFVHQLCLDLQRRGYFFPFFDKRFYSLPKGKEFAPLILEAAQKCQVAVIVLSEEYLSSKWPMIELVAFHAAQQQRLEAGEQLYLLPLFFKLSGEDLDDQRIKSHWMPKWKKLALKDGRIQLEKWSFAVKALRKVNGLIFGEFGKLEVPYRNAIVKSIFDLLPPDLLNNTSKSVVGYDRLCEALLNQFVVDKRTKTQVLGLYGLGGQGKTTMCRALGNYLHRSFLGRVCHLTLEKGSELQVLERQKLVLEKLCGFGRNVLDTIRYVGEGWELMQEHLMREPVFLVIDNVTNDKCSWDEAHAYLRVGFHLGSKILITSRCKDVIQELLPNLEFCMLLPKLMDEEAGAILLRSAAPWKTMPSLTDEERVILGFCLKRCIFPVDGVTWDQSNWMYHPLALEALGSFFYRINNTLMLPWKKFLEDNEEPLKHVWKSSNIFSILGLQFQTFHWKDQLIFLDIALYWRESSRSISRGDHVNVWLSKLHGISRTTLEFKLQDLRKSGLINYRRHRDGTIWDMEVHDLYKEFAEWYVTNEGEGPRNVWGVYQRVGLWPSIHQNPSCDHASSKCASNLVRLHIFDATRFELERDIADVGVQVFCNLVLLQLHRCTGFTELNLSGLRCLQDLELHGLKELVTVTLPGQLIANSLMEEERNHRSPSMHNSLRYVLFVGLDSLKYLPNFSSYSALEVLQIGDCTNLVTFQIECPELRCLELWGLHVSQLGRLPNFKLLTSLEILELHEINYNDALELPWNTGNVVLNFEGLECSKHFGSLYLGCPNVEIILGLAHLKQVEYIGFLLCWNLKEIPGLSRQCKLGASYWKCVDDGRIPGRYFDFGRFYSYPLQEFEVQDEDVNLHLN